MHARCRAQNRAPLPGGLVVFALPVVVAVPHRLVFQEFVRPLQNTHVVRCDWLISSLRSATLTEQQ